MGRVAVVRVVRVDDFTDFEVESERERETKLWQCENGVFYFLKNY